MIDKRVPAGTEAWLLEPGRGREGVGTVPLAAAASITFGRDPACEVVFDASFKGISRRHATVVADTSGLRVTDLGSSNGTYVNGTRIEGTRVLHAGDRLAFSDDVTLTVRAAQVSPKLVRPGGAVVANPRLLSDLLPFLSRRDKGSSLRHYLLPAILIAVGVVSLFITGASANQTTFLYVLAAFLGIGALAIVDALANHPRPWWMLALAALATAAVMLWPDSPLLRLDFYVFRHILPGTTQEGEGPSAHSFVAYFFGAGCAEELLKALPVLIALLVLRRRGFGPLDGLMFGAASGLGFTLVETLVQYVPEAVARAAEANGAMAAAFVGVELEIPRLLGAIMGHMAWAGYVGYAIGEAARTTDRKRRWQLVLGAYFVAALLHAAWDTVDLGSPVGVALSTAIGVVSFLLLASAAARGRFMEAPAAGASR